MKETDRLLLQIIRAGLLETEIPDECRSSLDDDTVKDVCRRAQEHGVLPMAADTILRCRAADNPVIEENLRRTLMSSVRRTETMTAEGKALGRVFEEEGIDHIFLKGCVLRSLYPRDYMRSSVDVDVLVRGEDRMRACAVLEKRMGYRFIQNTAHDSVFFTESGVNIELHFTLLEEGKANGSARVLENVWDHAVRSGGHAMIMNDDMFYLYFIVHMAKHFEESGIGIRFFTDLWLLTNRCEYDRGARERLLTECSLSLFEKRCLDLSEFWFSGAAPGEGTEEFADFVISGGVFGDGEKKIVFGQMKKGGRIKYYLSRLFLPVKNMKAIYPVLQKHAWLLPFMYVRRMGRIFDRDARSRAADDLSRANDPSGEQIDRARELFGYLGIEYGP